MLKKNATRLKIIIMGLFLFCCTCSACSRFECTSRHEAVKDYCDECSIGSFTIQKIGGKEKPPCSFYSIERANQAGKEAAISTFEIYGPLIIHYDEPTDSILISAAACWHKNKLIFEAVYIDNCRFVYEANLSKMPTTYVNGDFFGASGNEVYNVSTNDVLVDYKNSEGGKTILYGLSARKSDLFFVTSDDTRRIYLNRIKLKKHQSAVTYGTEEFAIPNIRVDDRSPLPHGGNFSYPHVSPNGTMVGFAIDKYLVVCSMENNICKTKSYDGYPFVWSINDLGQVKMRLLPDKYYAIAPCFLCCFHDEKFTMETIP